MAFLDLCVGLLQPFTFLCGHAQALLKQGALTLQLAELGGELAALLRGQGADAILTTTTM